MALTLRNRRTHALPERTAAGHLQLDAETDWLVEGDPHELAQLEATLPKEVRDRYGSTLVLRFGNAVGLFDGGPLGRLEVVTGKWGEADFDAMLAAITERMAQLPFAAGSGASLPYDRSIIGDRTVLYHLFVYLRHILSPTAPEPDQLLPVLRVVLAQPLRGLERVSHWTPIERIRQVDASSLLGAVTPRARLTRVPQPGNFAMALALDGHLPEQVQERRSETTLDVVENRFVKAFLDQALAIIDAVRTLALTKTPGSFPTALLADCSRMARALAPIRQHSMWRDVSDMRRLPGESQALQRRRGYKQVFRHFLRLRMACRLPFKSTERMLEIKDIAELYEMWCFFEVERQVTAALAEPPVSAETPAVTDFAARVPWNLRVAWAGGTELFYNLSFSPRNRENRSYSLGLRPDIVLRIPNGPNGGDHIFDAKFKVDTSAKRHGQFLRDDINKMHTYRDALPSVRSAWILYPGTVSRFYELERGRLNDLEDLSANPRGVGAIALLPAGDRQLTATGLAVTCVSLMSIDVA